ncbi:hypothetical protein HK097_003361 [Rhizophlyctis rosea]|uniref:Uncharacterized protein n=1 Tax=Rhizophlyctis rosea TaxID=64517 RepID=A0AAD5X6U6_9FUNG|nr:hypothetical protein HK097_003361 [Rhizophlyctis rosea]
MSQYIASSKAASNKRNQKQTKLPVPYTDALAKAREIAARLKAEAKSLTQRPTPSDSESSLSSKTGSTSAGVKRSVLSYHSRDRESASITESSVKKKIQKSTYHYLQSKLCWGEGEIVGVTPFNKEADEVIQWTDASVKLEPVPAAGLGIVSRDPDYPSAGIEVDKPIRNVNILEAMAALAALRRLNRKHNAIIITAVKGVAHLLCGESSTAKDFRFLGETRSGGVKFAWMKAHQDPTPGSKAWNGNEEADKVAKIAMNRVMIRKRGQKDVGKLTRLERSLRP